MKLGFHFLKSFPLWASVKYSIDCYSHSTDVQTLRVNACPVTNTITGETKVTTLAFYKLTQKVFFLGIFPSISKILLEIHHFKSALYVWNRVSFNSKIYNGYPCPKGNAANLNNSPILKPWVTVKAYFDIELLRNPLSSEPCNLWHPEALWLHKPVRAWSWSEFCSLVVLTSNQNSCESSRCLGF